MTEPTKDEAKEIQPYVIFPDRTTDIKVPFVLDVHSPTVEVQYEEREPVQITRTNEAVSGKMFVLHADGTITNEKGERAEGFLVEKLSERMAAPDPGDDAEAGELTDPESPADDEVSPAAPFDAVDAATVASEPQGEPQPEPTPPVLPPA